MSQTQSYQPPSRSAGENLFLRELDRLERNARELRELIDSTLVSFPVGR